MKPGLGQRAEELFHAALERSPECRRAFLEEACGPDAGLRRRVEELVSAEEGAGSVLETPALESIARASRDSEDRELPSDRTGQILAFHYRVLEKIGEGGMGQVYRAYDSKLGREVAIKFLPPEFRSDRDRLARFRQEAHILASLNHPNIGAIYGLEESGEADCLVLELVKGRTLAERIAAGPIPTEEVLLIARQIGEAMAAAHGQGIIHRDLKPANVMISEGGRVKVLDFGLASPVDAVGPAAARPRPAFGLEEETVAGTIGYMSPEQVRGLSLDCRTDLFSLGVILYEMVTRKRAFAGGSLAQIADAILHTPAGEGSDRLTPTRLKSIIDKLLAKDPADRYRNAGAVLRDLKEWETSRERVRLLRKARRVAGAVVVLAAVLAGWFWHGVSRERWALQTAAPEITRRIEAGEYVGAAALARQARAVLPGDATLEKLWFRSTGEVSIATVPDGAEVSVRPYRGDPNSWEALGRTPLRKVRLPRDTYVWRLRQPGFTFAFFIAEALGMPPPGFPSGSNVNMTSFTAPNLDVTLPLRPAGSVPPEMVAVLGGRTGLGYPFDQAPAVQVNDFLIDRHEVTNEEYRKFVDAGGYRRQEFWKQPFVMEGRAVSWKEAIARFQDATGWSGPATWARGDYPEGRGKHPVAGVSWYEAAAYADFVHKSLPTAYHWTRASQSPGYTPLIVSGSNFSLEGTRPVGSAGSLSGFGTTDMAGNVKEWCWNETGKARRLNMGGGFGEPNYMFNQADAPSPWERRTNFGFRCVRLDSPPDASAAAPVEVALRDYGQEKPVAEEIFRAYAALYAYDKTELNARVEETYPMEVSFCERVTFDAAYGRERITAYLFLPKNASPPYQAVVYFPGIFAFMDDRLDLANVEDTRGFLMKSGRALVFPVCQGMYQRRDGFVPGGKIPPVQRRDHWIAWAKDLSRSLDYLEKRTDIDSAKVAYFGDSLGGMFGAFLPAVEKRIKAAILSSGGLHSTIQSLPEGDPFHFVTRVTVPVLLLSGRYDAICPLESTQRPLFRLLGTPGGDKKQVIYEGGHGAFPRPDAVRECLGWLDRYLGPPRH